jgi:pimeloyl-ACP methyl ester carboxylesterase
MVLMGHSAGGHIVTQYLNNTCRFVKGLILLDAVDGMDPFGIIKIYITHPPQMLPFVTPSLVIATGFDGD